MRDLLETFVLRDILETFVLSINLRQRLVSFNNLIDRPWLEAFTVRSDADRHVIYHTLMYISKKTVTYQTPGRVLRNDLPQYNLCRGDRLEPCDDLPDIADFERAATPFNCIFWRMKSTDRVVHDSPLLHIPGVGVETYRIDLLHAWRLGPLGVLVAECLWFCVRCRVFVPRTLLYLGSDELNALSMLQIRSELTIYYYIRRRTDPTWERLSSEICELSLKMIGKPNKPQLKAKAAESRAMLGFAVELMKTAMVRVREHRPNAQLEGSFLLGAAENALQFDTLLGEAPAVVPLHTLEEMLGAYKRYDHLFRRASGRIVPKNHILIHAILDTPACGNPRLYMTYRDEALNGCIARIARSCHYNTFGDMIHFKFSVLQEMGLSSNAQRYI